MTKDFPMSSVILLPLEGGEGWIAVSVFDLSEESLEGRLQSVLLGSDFVGGVMQTHFPCMTPTPSKPVDSWVSAPISIAAHQCNCC